MPLELGIWRIDKGVQPVEFGTFNLESRLEDILSENIEIASPNWLVIGRQVRTEHGGFIDLLAMDQDANLVVLELKRHQTHRDIVAQLLDYGSWVARLEANHIVQIFDEYQKRWKKNEIVSIDEAFRSKFGISMPDEMNQSHELVIVAASLDQATERVVRYLAGEHRVPINAVFFRVFRDGDREYISRAWFRDPAEIIVDPPDGEGEWNGEYYVSFGYPHEVVRDGLRRGYVVAGGGSWYSRTLQMLEPGARIWVNVPGTGYVGVGNVISTMVPVDEFTVRDENGNEVPIVQVSDSAASLNRAADDPETADYLVRVDWLKTVEPEQAIKEKGFFGNQNTVARPRAAKWVYTVERLKSRFGID
ncbi:MAG: endonuclease NucS domain-containing protein [Dethiobacteria bacterium]|jgi:hypothetical protein|nr:endonuclease NucS [Bacillota bacterium]